MNETTKQLPTAGTDRDTLNDLLRGEISAVETYEQSIKKFSASVHPLAEPLGRIRDEHAQVVNVLADRVRGYGGTPAEGAGVWGVFANAVAGAAKLIGPRTALSALKQGEEHGIASYEKALQKQDLTTETQYLIRNELLPRCQDHVRTLERVLGLLEHADEK